MFIYGKNIKIKVINILLFNRLNINLGHFIKIRKRRVT